MLHDVWVVFTKECVDALRDRRTLLVVLLSSVLLGPLVLVALANLVATLESRADRREVVVAGAAHAPGLVNYIERQTWTIKPAPPDYETQLRRGTLGDPVIVIPPGFEAALLRAEAPVVEVVSDSANRRAQAGVGAARGLLQGYARERAALSVALRGLSPALLAPLEVQARDLASTQTRGAQFTGMLPFFVLMAVLYGALNAALDTTAGERERGSLEPLLMNPAAHLAVVLGKWGAVALLGMLIAVLACFSFVPAQWLLRSDTLAALLRFGWREALLFLAVLLPLAAALAAVLMAVAIRCKSFKEAQANTTVVVLAVSVLPLVSLFDQGGEAPWHFAVPALAQFALMTRVLEGEALGVAQVLLPLAMCVLLSVAALWFVAGSLRNAAVR